MFDGEVLVLGLGSIGERHVRNLRQMGQKSIAVLRRESQPPLTVSENDFTTVTDLTTALDRRPVAAIICLPSSMHTSALRACVQAGIPSLVEVPLAHTLESLAEICNLAETHEVPVLMGHNLRFHAGLDAIKRAVMSGRLGKPLYSRAQFGEWLPGNHQWEDYRTRYEAKKELGGGAILTSIHEIDHAYWLFGPFDSVTAVARTRHLDVEVEDVAMMIFEHSTGMLSEIVLDFVQRVYRRNLQIVGTEGTIEWELLGNRVGIFESNKGEWSDLFKFEGDLNVKDMINQTYLDELMHFCEVVNGVIAPINSLRDGICVLNAGLSALESSGLGSRVRINSLDDVLA